jgi:hypothetical protein
MLIVGAAATQNALPAAAQRFVSHAAGIVGLDVPRPVEDVDESPDDTRGPSGSTQTPEGNEAPDPTGGAEAPPVTPGIGPSSKSGPPVETPGGATPADPGTPGDHEPATPAVPPAHSDGGGSREREGNNEEQGRDTAPAQTDGRGADKQG